MPAFDVSFLNKKFRKSSSNDYGFLADQLDIKRSQLESDGKLSPGDYDVLINAAQKIYSHPGLSAAQRSNIDVKIENYKSAKSSSTINRQNDIAELNRSLKSDAAEVTMRFGNDPKKFLNTQAALQVAKIDRLSDSINRLNSAGDDSTAHMNELNSALQDYQDTLQALNDVETYTPGSAPKSNYAAYVTTNAKGQITDLKVSKVGTVTGYSETNGVYSGLPIYGKMNRKENGRNVFVLGNTQFSAPDIVVPGADGSLKTATLVSQDKTKGQGGPLTIAETGYSDVDPKSLQTQSAIPDGGWFEGDKGFLYNKNSDGTYTKYVNYSKEKLGLQDNQVVRMPNSFEANILPSVAKTEDGLMQPNLPLPSSMPATPTTPAPAQPTPATPIESPLSAGRPRTPSAIERSPSTAGGYAQQALGSAKSFLGRLFSR